MKIYEIRDGENEREIGTLLYYEKNRSFIVELNDEVDEWNTPLLFSEFVKKKEYTIPRDISLMWVKERVIPNTRQNIGSILKNHKLKEYDEMKFLELSKGKCSQDSLYITKIKELPEYIIERRIRNLADCTISPGGYLICFFRDKASKIVSLSLLEEFTDGKKITGNRELLESGFVGCDGYYLTFNDSIDIPASFLYTHGTDIQVSLEDFICFAKNNILDTPQTCDQLSCTRQNLSYFLKKNKLAPVRENVKGNLYLKNSLHANLP